MVHRKPLISIGLPVYNGAEFLGDAIESLLNQTIKDFELIISDNASTDLTEQICMRYLVQDSRIRYVRQEKNIGAFENFRYVLQQACGQYFMWHAADDTRATDCIEHYLRNIGGAGGCFSTYATVNRKSGSTTTVSVPVMCPEHSRRDSLRSFFISPRSCMFYGLYRLDAAKACFPITTFDWLDYYFVLQVIHRFGFAVADSSPKYFSHFYGQYIPKPKNGKYVNSYPYFWRVFSLALYAGPIALAFHINILRVTMKVNSAISYSHSSCNED